MNIHSFGSLFTLRALEQSLRDQKNFIMYGFGSRGCSVRQDIFLLFILSLFHSFVLFPLSFVVFFIISYFGYQQVILQKGGRGVRRKVDMQALCTAWDVFTLRKCRNSLKAVVYSKLSMDLGKLQKIGERLLTPRNSPYVYRNSRNSLCTYALLC